MHAYYAENRKKLKRELRSFLRPVEAELERSSQKAFADLFREIWDHYEKNMLENFPYIGGDAVSGTKNLTGAFALVSMGEVLRGYGASLEECGHVMVLAYERKFSSLPGIVRRILHRSFMNTEKLTRRALRKDAANAANAAAYPGSFETQTQIPPEPGYDFSYHNLVCPPSDFARKYGYEEYMPYLCNLDYVMFAAFGVPLYREHTCFEDGDCCDFKIKKGAPLLPYWPPVFTQGKGYK